MVSAPVGHTSRVCRSAKDPVAGLGIVAIRLWFWLSDPFGLALMGVGVVDREEGYSAEGSHFSVCESLACDTCQVNIQLWIHGCRSSSLPLASYADESSQAGCYRGKRCMRRFSRPG